MQGGVGVHNLVSDHRLVMGSRGLLGLDIVQDANLLRDDIGNISTGNRQREEGPLILLTSGLPLRLGA